MEKQIKVIVPKDAVPIPDMPKRDVAKPPPDHESVFFNMDPMDLDGEFHEDDDQEQVDAKNGAMVDQIMQQAKAHAQKCVDDIAAATSAKRRKGKDGEAEKTQAKEALQEAKDQLPHKVALLAASGSVGSDTKSG